jgi:hypothetical protein
MVQIVHLARGEQPAQGGRFILIERCSPGGRTTLVHSRDGILVKVPAPFLKTEIDAFCRMAEEAGIARLYVSGAAENLDEARGAPILSPWAA